jgi:hypothetical protein
MHWCLTGRFWQINAAIKVLDCNPPIRNNPRNYHILDIQGLEVRNNRFVHLLICFIGCIKLIQDLLVRFSMLPRLPRNLEAIGR